ncbi:hypothetical protein Tco_0613723 [Tanacetum coccineum]
MYNSWQSRMLLYIKGKKNGRMMLESIENGPLIYPTIEENGQIRNKRYAELTEQEQLQDDYYVQATSIVLQGLPLDVYSLFSHCDDPIACLNKAMAFMSTVMASRFPSTNNQLRTSSIPRNQATIQDGSVTVQQEKGIWQGNALSLRRQGILHGSRKRCTGSGTKLTDDLDAYDSDCDDISSSKAVLMANLSSYDSDVLFEDKVNQETKTVNEFLTAELERYKKRVKTFEQRLNVDLSCHEKLID